MRKGVFVVLIFGTVAGLLISSTKLFYDIAHGSVYVLLGSLLTAALLLIWCAVFVRAEPRLVRISLIILAILFALQMFSYLWMIFPSMPVF